MQDSSRRKANRSNDGSKREEAQAKPTRKPTVLVSCRAKLLWDDFGWRGSSSEPKAEVSGPKPHLITDRCIAEDGNAWDVLHSSDSRRPGQRGFILAWFKELILQYSTLPNEAKLSRAEQYGKSMQCNVAVPNTIELFQCGFWPSWEHCKTQFGMNTDSSRRSFARYKSYRS